jgi:hypothetical protein
LFSKAKEKREKAQWFTPGILSSDSLIPTVNDNYAKHDGDNDCENCHNGRVEPIHVSINQVLKANDTNGTYQEKLKNHFHDVPLSTFTQEITTFQS